MLYLKDIMPTKKENKRSFSLIEIMIALSILAIVSSALVYKTNVLIEKHRFETSFLKIKNKLLFAKQMALVSQNDIFLTFTNTNNNLVYALYSDGDKTPIDTEVLKNIFIQINNEKKSFQINISSTGWFYPRAKITLFQKKHNFKNFKTIDLEEIFIQESPVHKSY